MKPVKHRGLTKAAGRRLAQKTSAELSKLINDQTVMITSCPAAEALKKAAPSPLVIDARRNSFTPKSETSDNPDYFETSDNPADPDYSSTIQSAAYWPKEQRLQIRFRDRTNPEGRLYEYNGTLLGNPKLEAWKQAHTLGKEISTDLALTPKLWRAFVEAGSKGSFASNWITGVFKGVRV